jgi:hypothetical protein
MVSVSMKTIFAFALLAIASQPAKGEVQKGGWSRGWLGGWPGWRGYYGWGSWAPWNRWNGYWWKKRSLRADA